MHSFAKCSYTLSTSVFSVGHVHFHGNKFRRGKHPKRSIITRHRLKKPTGLRNRYRVVRWTLTPFKKTTFIARKIPTKSAKFACNVSFLTCGIRSSKLLWRWILAKFHIRKFLIAPPPRFLCIWFMYYKQKNRRK